MKKLLLLILTLPVLFSCAKFKQRVCEAEFKQIIYQSHKKNSVNLVKGSIYIKGILFLFNVRIKGKTDISLFTPVGTRFARFVEDKDNVCLFLKNNKICGKAPFIYREVLKENIPFTLTDILTGHFNISTNSSYVCQNNKIIISDKNKRYIYEKEKLKGIFYKNFSLLYDYEDGSLKRITLKIGDDNFAKIFIRDIE